MYWNLENVSDSRFLIHSFYDPANTRMMFDWGGAISNTTRIVYNMDSTPKYLSKPIVARFKRSTSGTQSILINGSAKATCSNCSGTLTQASTYTFYIGVSSEQMLGEIIIFNRALDDDEADAVNDYTKLTKSN